MTTAADYCLLARCEHYTQCLSRKDVMHAVRTGSILHQREGVTITRVHQVAVLKYGPDVSLAEARNMRLVLERTNVRLPAVFDAWEGQDDRRGIGYLLMEYIEGDTVANQWPGLDIHARQHIHSQLYQFLHQLHTLRLSAPGPLGEDLSRGPLFTDYGAGPFKSQSDLENWFNERLLVCKEFQRAPQTQLSFSGQFKDLVMCHMDIAARNLILDRQQRLWVLDWAHAGGYPVYFEMAVLRRTGDPDFTNGLLEMIGDEHVEDVERLLAVGYALTTAACTRPAGVSKT